MVCCCEPVYRCSFYISSNIFGRYTCRVEYYDSNNIILLRISFTDNSSVVAEFYNSSQQLLKTETFVNNFPVDDLSSFFIPYPTPLLVGTYYTIEQVQQMLYYDSCSFDKAYRFKDVFEEILPLVPFFNEIKFSFKFSSSISKPDYSISFNDSNTSRDYKHIKGTVIYYIKPRGASCVTSDNISGYSSSPYTVCTSFYRCSSPVDSTSIAEFISSYCIKEFFNAKI